ncbi:S8 family serine peptidase [Prochlorococcus marinus]|uniref:S8 family serine peptidase n=2 Tax=Prochlorococcus marinus TaxID=1219 RepID=UPI0039B437A1
MDLLDLQTHEYIASHHEVLDSYGFDISSFINHKKNYLQNESQFLDIYDETKNILNPLDLKAALVSDKTNESINFITNGYGEGRSYYHLTGESIENNSPSDSNRNDIAITALTAVQALNYIASHPDLIVAFGTNTDLASSHYINYGKAEGRALDTFNPINYLANYADLRSAFGSDTKAAIRHFITNGYGEGRSYYHLTGESIENNSPSDSNRNDIAITALTAVQALNYIASHPDLIVAFGTNTDLASSHYINYGKAEGRALDTFNPINYLANYADLRSAFGSDTKAAIRHFITNGYGEGRSYYHLTGESIENNSPSDSNRNDIAITALTAVQALNYIASHPDLIVAFGTNTDLASSHYINYGKAEGRALDTFNPINYLANYADLRSAFGSDTKAAIRHFITNGYGEGRSYYHLTGESIENNSPSDSNRNDIAITALTAVQALNYIASHPDLIVAFGTNTDLASSHYINYGKAEGRVLDTFDELSYLASNSDLIRNTSDNMSSAIIHYINYGFRERRIIDTFDEFSYLASHIDLLNAYHNSDFDPTYHYIKHGFNEKRSLDTFDEWLYAASYNDVFNSCGNDSFAMVKHYVDYGFLQNRNITAKRLYIGGSIEGEIDSLRTNDWIPVSLNAGDFYQFDMVGMTLEDTFLYLLDSSGNILASDNDSGTGLNSKMLFEAPFSGNYYLEAAANNRSINSGTYSLSVNQLTDDYTSDINTLGQIIIGESNNGDLERVGDHDWFSVRLMASETYTFDLLGDTLDDPYLSLYKIDMNGDIRLIASDDNSGIDRNSRIIYECHETTDYYLDVGSKDNSLIGNYSISAIQSLDDFTADITTSGSVVVGTQSFGSLEHNEDHDWFSISLIENINYTIDLIALSLSNPSLIIRDNLGNPIHSDDDGGAGLNAQFTFNVNTSGIYFLDVYSSTQATGTYTLSATDNNSDDTPTNDDYSQDMNTNGFITVGESITGVLEGVGDRDWFRIVLTAGETYQFDLVGNTLRDTHLYLRDSLGNLILADDDSGSELNSRISYTASASTHYYLEAAGYRDYYTGTYTISTTGNNSDNTPTNDDYSQNINTDGIITVGESITGELERVGDRDWFRIALTSGETYQFDLVGNTLRNTYLYLNDSSGTLILSDDDSGSDSNSRIVYTASESKTYYLEAAGYSNYYTGTYTLSVTVNNSDDSPTNDDYSQDMNTNGFITVGESITGVLEGVGDRDWFRIVLTAGETYQFDLVGNTLRDTHLYLRDSLGNLILADDDSGSELNSRISYTASASTHYYLEAAGYRDYYTGTYTISTTGNNSDNTPTNDDYSQNINTDGIITVGESITGELERVGDRDWFRIALTVGETYQFDLEGDTLMDPTLYLRDSNGIELDFSNDTTNSRNSSIIFTPSSSAIYYLESASYLDLYQGGYTLSAKLNQFEDSPAQDDYLDNRNTNGSIEVGESVHGVLERVGDRDWFAINLNSGITYQFDLVGNTLSDTYLYLHSETQIVGRDDDSGDNYNSTIIYEVGQNGTYYLDAGSYTNSLIGTYTLSAVIDPGTTINPSIPVTDTRNGTPAPTGFSSLDGYGQINAERAFEQLLGFDLENRPNLGGNLWGLDQIGVPEVWFSAGSFNGETGEGVTVAVVDTGVDLDHPEFENRIVAGYDFVDNDHSPNDEHSHGTHVAGIIAGAMDGEGVTGVAFDAQIMPIRVLDSQGYGITENIISGIRWAADNGADVINLSLAGGPYNQAELDAIEYATSLGSVVVMAAGNSGYSRPDYPAAYSSDYGLAVGAVDSTGNMAYFSNRAGNTIMDYVTAPGGDIYSSVIDGGYDSYNGTSMASPYVAGVAALLSGHDESLTPSQIENILVTSSRNSNLIAGNSNRLSSEINTNYLFNINNLDTITGLNV